MVKPRPIRLSAIDTTIASPGLRMWNSANSKPINMPASIAHKTPQKTWPNIKLPRTAAKAPIKMKPSNAMLKTPAL